MALFACFLTLVQRFFAAFTIAALPAADRTRFLRVTSRMVERPNTSGAGPRTHFRAAMLFGSGKLDVTLSLRVSGLWAYLSIS
jgi:hypothetical protein